MQNIKNELQNYLEDADKSIQEILFIPNSNHPVWDDNLEILQLAHKQILQPLGVFPTEQVFAFIGMHSRTVITGKRDSIGFLITNFRILIQTDFSVIGTVEKAQNILFTKAQNPDELSAKAWNDFLVKNRTTIGQEQLEAFQESLNEVIEIVLPQIQNLNYLPEEILKSTNIDARIKDLGLQSTLKNNEQDEKKIKQFAEKFKVSDIQFGVLDKPFFGGVYGLVITKTGIASRDLMEESVTSTWEEISKNPATLGEKKDVILAGQQRHIVPAHASQFVPSIITLINELATGEVLI